MISKFRSKRNYSELIPRAILYSLIDLLTPHTETDASLHEFIRITMMMIKKMMKMIY